MAILIIGTEECAFYSKSLIFRTNPQQHNVYSLVLSKHDITFGCSDKLEKAVKKIQAGKGCKALLVISSCVIELIGEDVESVLGILSHRGECNVMFIRTEHFTKDIPVSGLCDTLSALFDLMDDPTECLQSVNVLGHRFDEFKETELCRFLASSNVKINTQIPARCSVADIKRAPAAALNIVTHFAALKLAEKMKDAFGIQYVYFGKDLDSERIKAAYHGIEERLNLSWGVAIDKLNGRLVKARNAFTKAVQGKTFIFGSPPLYAFHLSWFFCDCNMVPLWIQAAGFQESDEDPVRKMLSSGYDPKVSRALNEAPMDLVCEQLRPDYYFNHHPRRPSSYEATRAIPLMKEIRGIGFEVPLGIIDRIMKEF